MATTRGAVVDSVIMTTADGKTRDIKPALDRQDLMDRVFAAVKDGIAALLDEHKGAIVTAMGDAAVAAAQEGEGNKIPAYKVAIGVTLEDAGKVVVHEESLSWAVRHKAVTERAMVDLHPTLPGMGDGK